jgi:hypothetical protein
MKEECRGFSLYGGLRVGPVKQSSSIQQIDDEKEKGFIP